MRYPPKGLHRLEPARPDRRLRTAPWLLALLLLAMLDGATADLRTTLSPFVVSSQAGAEPDAQLEAQLDAGPETKSELEPPTIAFGDRELGLYSTRLLAELYAERDFAPAWNTRRAEAMLMLARQSRADGFEPADFHAEAVAAVLDGGDLDSVDPARRDAAELLLSDALLRYLHHFRFGKLDPQHVNRGRTFVEPAAAEQLKADMARALATADMAAELRAILPSPSFYRYLKQGYQRYLAIADRGGWQEIQVGPNLRVGIRDPRVPMIREHLEVTEGYDPGYVAEPDLYDQDLASAIKGFQRRSGLAADGIVGPNTLRALNQPLDERLLTIRANLERMRWLYNDLPPDYLFVDLAAFELSLVRNDAEVWRTKGIIGTVENQTPMFRDEMEHLVFNPTWTVPRSIEKKFRGVPAGYRRVRSGGRYYLVQQPGPRNALGRVKFMFPNGHAIYLHDTPSRYLFSRAQRAYSHGCIRVHQPLRLAQQVLNEPAWSEAEINRVVRRGSTRWVHLDEHLAVLLYYLTAKADEQGRVGFRRDIYKRDRRLLAALDKPAATGAERIAFAQPKLESESSPENTPPDAPAVKAPAEAVAATGGDAAVTRAGSATLSRTDAVADVQAPFAEARPAEDAEDSSAPWATASSAVADALPATNAAAQPQAEPAAAKAPAVTGSLPASQATDGGETLGALAGEAPVAHRAPAAEDGAAAELIEAGQGQAPGQSTARDEVTDADAAPEQPADDASPETQG